MTKPSQAVEAAARAILEFYESTTEAKRPDVFAKRMNALRVALSRPLEVAAEVEFSNEQLADMVPDGFVVTEQGGERRTAMTLPQLRQFVANVLAASRVPGALVASRAQDSALLAAAQRVDCACSPRERDSGHRIGCWMPALQEAIIATPSGGAGCSVGAVKATLFHDAGAVAQCGYCKRYTMDARALSDRQPMCECGEWHGWSGSFKPPTADSKWYGPRPAQMTATPAASVPLGGGEAYDWEAEALLQRERIMRIAKALRPEMGSYFFEDVIQAVEKILTEHRAAQPTTAQDAKDARPDSVHLGSGASGNVRAPGPTDAKGGA